MRKRVTILVFADYTIATVQEGNNTLEYAKAVEAMKNPKGAFVAPVALYELTVGGES